MSGEATAISLLLLGVSSLVAVTWFIAWMIAGPHDEIQTDFDSLKQKERL